MKRLIAFCALLLTIPVSAAELRVGFGQVDITPAIGEKPVWVAGFGNNRRATGVNDPLMVRAIVLTDGKTKIAIASVDVVGIFYPYVQSIRKQLTGFDSVTVSATHNHEGPDTLGLWGKTPLVSGLDPAYMKQLEGGVVAAIKQADGSLQTVTGRIGTKALPELLNDGRLPIIKHDELVALTFMNVTTKKPAGIVVQWNNHPETLGDKNTKLSADYVGYTIDEIKKKYDCPIVYLTGTVGGLMTSLRVNILDAKGREMIEGSFEKNERYGRLVGQGAIAAIENSKDVELTPIQARHASFFLPCDNKMFVIGRQMGTIMRDAYIYSDDPAKVVPLERDFTKHRMCMKTEVGWLKLGQLEIALIPGEIYPELVLDKVPDPAPEGADYPDAPIEPAIYKQLKSPHRMIIGLANDELGYFLPKRQWDEKAPYTYGYKKAPYGEVNSPGPETGPRVCEEFRKLVHGK